MESVESGEYAFGGPSPKLEERIAALEADRVQQAALFKGLADNHNETLRTLQQQARFNLAMNAYWDAQELFNKEVVNQQETVLSAVNVPVNGRLAALLSSLSVLLRRGKNA